jgi:hypothetical protein
MAVGRCSVLEATAQAAGVGRASTGSICLSVALAVVVVGCRPGAINTDAETVLGPGGIDIATDNCPTGYRVVDGNHHSLSPGSEVFFSRSFGSERTWYVGLDNFGNRHSKRDGAVQVRATCAPSDKPRSKRAERGARQRVNAAVRRHMTEVGYVEEYGDFGAFSTPKD